MISPEEEELYRALNQILDNNQLRSSLQKHAYATIRSSFSLAKWQEKWIEVINKAHVNHIR